MNLSLVVLTPGPNEGKVIPIRTCPFLVGRSPQCHLRPASPLISQRHCALVLQGAQAAEGTSFPRPSSTPLPPTRQARSGASIDKAVAQLLLEMPAGDRAAPASLTLDGEGVPTGGTLPDHRPAVAAAPASKSSSPRSPSTLLDHRPAAAAAADDPRPNVWDAKEAAKALLEKYLRRKRT